MKIKRVIRMKQHLLKIRNKEIYNFWERKKAFLTMADISEIYNLPVKTIYRIISENKKK